uniref:Unc-13 homolog D (C. elegans) n=1 Tax=Poecilia mexicana TaxID=48701 RepID=A0A3B3WM14_9TELE
MAGQTEQNTRKGENLLQTPEQKLFFLSQQFSPVHSRKLGFTRRQRDRRDLKEDENPEAKARRHKEMELKPLYKELLYTIAHKMGKPASAEVFTDSQLHQYLKEAFTMTDEEHNGLMEKVQNTEPPIYCLMVTVKEAKEILGKDVSGFSDPYCLLMVLEEEEEKKSSRAKAKPSKYVVKVQICDKFLINYGERARGKKRHFAKVSLTQKLEEIKTNLNSLRRMIKEAKKEKGTDDFLGNIVLRLKDLHCTEDNWYKLEPRTETYPNRGQCHLFLQFIHKARDGTLSAGRNAYTNYCGILQQFVQAYISKQQSSAPWKGALCGEAQTLLELYATQNDLSPFLQDLAKWVAYSKLYQSLEVDSSVLFHQLTSIEYHWHQQELPYQQKQELGDSLHGFLQYGLCLVSKYRDIFPPTPSATPKLHTLLRILVQICKTQAFQKLNPANFELHNEVHDAIVTGTEEWFTIKKGLHQPMTKDLTEIGSALSRLIAEVQEDIKHNKDVWNRVFVSAVQVDVFTVVYQKFDSLLAKEVKATLSIMEDQMELNLSKSLFPVYLSLQAIHKDKAFLQKRGLLQLTNFHEDFRDALPYWLNQAFSTTQDRVVRAVQVDQLQPLQVGAVPIKHSSSAVDLVACIQPICHLWEQLSWPDPEEAFMLMVKLTEDVCKIVVNYCHLLKERVRVLSENSDHSIAINMLCVVVNDLEHLRSVLTRLPSQLNWEGLRIRTQSVIGQSQFENTLHSQLQQAKSILCKEIRSALDTLGKQVDHESRALVLLTPLWQNSVKILYQISTQHSQQEGLMVFCQRLLYTLQCLEQCFHADGNGLPQKALHSDEYKNLKAHLTHHSLTSHQLIEKFFKRKISEQVNYQGEKYGAVTLLTSYRRSDQRLHIEVLNAVSLLPMDSNGLSDPFVRLCLEPNHVFPEIEPRCTQYKSCDLNPLFDEAFDFLVSLDQCQTPGACLVVTVLDHDTLRPDDFEGEAFLALEDVPGVSEQEGEEVDSQMDSAPEQIRLPLMHPKPNEDSILKLLESRRGEREAQAFVKKRRQREKQSQEAAQQ